MEIQSIEITNVKGIGNGNYSLNLIPNKPSILVAPNGFGKSSIAVAFDSLKRNRIELDSDHYHMNTDSNRPILSIIINENGTSRTLIANDTINTISVEFDVFVINSQLMAKATKQSFAGKTFVKSSLEIKPIILVPTLPQKISFNYSSGEMKTLFGANGKILPNILSVFSCAPLLLDILQQVDLNRFNQVKLSKSFDKIKEEINSQTGTSDSIRQWIETHKLPDLRNIEELNQLATILRRFDGVKSDLDSFLSAFQIIQVYKTLGSDFRKAVNYANYIDDKNYYENTISSFNTTRYTIRPKEDRKHNHLVVEWPKAHEISNGQRDVLSFITMLMKAKRNFKKQNCILIIDEIFDYLDDANLISFQYFITNMIEEMKKLGKTFFPILMTHLDPLYFNHFCFNKHKIKVVFLKQSAFTSNPNIVDLIRKREDITIQSMANKHFFHYCPTHFDLSIQFAALRLPITWGHSQRFHGVISAEISKYLNDRIDFCPLAICFGVRVKIESILYNNIANAHHKQIFLDTHGTKKKLDYCEEIGLNVSENFYLLGIIYNDNLHIRNGQDLAKSVAIKLENLTIKKMIREVFTD